MAASNLLLFHERVIFLPYLSNTRNKCISQWKDKTDPNLVSRFVLFNLLLPSALEQLLRPGTRQGTPVQNFLLKCCVILVILDPRNRLRKCLGCSKEHTEPAELMKMLIVLLEQVSGTWTPWERPRVETNPFRAPPDSCNKFFSLFCGHLPLCTLKNEIVDFKTDVLSIFLLLPDTIAHSSFTKRLNWSRRFFSLMFRDFLKDAEKSVHTCCSLVVVLCFDFETTETYLFTDSFSLSSPSSGDGDLSAGGWFLPRTKWKQVSKICSCIEHFRKQRALQACKVTWPSKCRGVNVIFWTTTVVPHLLSWLVSLVKPQLGENLVRFLSCVTKLKRDNTIDCSNALSESSTAQVPCLKECVQNSSYVSFIPNAWQTFVDRFTSSLNFWTRSIILKNSFDDNVEKF